MHLRGRPSGPVVSLSWPSSTAILLSTLPPFLIPSPLPPLPLSPLSLLSRASIILWPVAFRNLFVIKAAIYFTLIEEIGRLPLAATIYHVPTPLSLLLSASFTLHRVSRRLYAVEDVFTNIYVQLRESLHGISACTYIYICFIFTAYGYTGCIVKCTKRYPVTKCKTCSTPSFLCHTRRIIRHVSLN